MKNSSFKDNILIFVLIILSLIFTLAIGVLMLLNGRPLAIRGICATAGNLRVNNVRPYGNNTIYSL